eukprot:531015-Hanusia_phi.AAC.2
MMTYESILLSFNPTNPDRCSSSPSSSPLPPPLPPLLLSLPSPPILLPLPFSAHLLLTRLPRCPAAGGASATTTSSSLLAPLHSSSSLLNVIPLFSLPLLLLLLPVHANLLLLHHTPPESSSSFFHLSYLNSLLQFSSDDFVQLFGESLPEVQPYDKNLGPSRPSSSLPPAEILPYPERACVPQASLLCTSPASPCSAARARPSGAAAPPPDQTRAGATRGAGGAGADGEQESYEDEQLHLPTSSFWAAQGGEGAHYKYLFLQLLSPLVPPLLPLLSSPSPPLPPPPPPPPPPLQSYVFACQQKKKSIGLDGQLSFHEVEVKLFTSQSYSV